jgi:hypothetical protein
MFSVARSFIERPKGSSSIEQELSHHHLYALIQKENEKSINLGKPDGPIFQTKTSGFDRTKDTMAEEEDCSTSSSDIDDDDTDDKYDDQELLLEFKKLISKHIKL